MLHSAQLARFFKGESVEAAPHFSFGGFLLQRQNSVVFLASWLDACSAWRFFFPYMSMPGSSFFFFGKSPDFTRVANCDVCAVQRCFAEQQYNFMRIAQSFGMKLIYEIDDDVFDLPDYNPAKQMLESQRAGFIACIRMADLVTVSTKMLEKQLRRNVKFMVNNKGHAIPTMVVPNMILPKLFATPIKNEGERLKIGWQGGSSHAGDLDLILAAVVGCLESYPVDVEYRGCVLHPDNPLWKFSGFQHKYWIPISEYACRMPCWGWDIAVAPLTEHEFNASKSAIKMIEAGFCGIPCLASWVRPYDEFCGHDPELRWLLCAGHSSWDKKLRELINDSARREEMGKRMQKVVEQHYSIADGEAHPGWVKALQAVRAL